MTLTDRHLDELKRQRWLGFEAEVRRYQGILARDPRGLFPLAERAKSRNDVLAICAIGEALIEADGLRLKPLRRDGFIGVLLTTLVEERRYAQALTVFDSLSDEDRSAAKVWVMRAKALGGLGDFAGARGAVQTALGLDPQVRDGAQFKALLVTRRELRSKLETGEAGWAQLRRLIDIYLELGQGEIAGRLVKSRYPRLPPAQPEDYEHGLAMLQAALPLLGANFVLAQGGRLAPVRQDDRLKALIAEARISTGRPEEAVGPDEGGRDLRLQRALACAASGEIEEAISRLGRLTVKLREDLEVRAALDFQVGRRVLEQAPLVLRPSGGPRRIFNLMPFNDEIPLLKMHLAEMAEWVDLFVIAESEVTFTGQPKPLHFERHKAEFSAYADKIRHVVVPEHPPAFHTPWGRDFRQRDLAAAALSGLAAADDLVLLTDVDEIVDRRALEGFEGDLAGFQMAMFRFFLNYRPTTANAPMRPTGAVVRAELLQRFGSSYLRFDLARSKVGQRLNDAGWHFTSVCDPQRLVAKINSYAHQERKAEWRDLDAVDRRLAEIKAGQCEKGWERAEIDERFPAYLRERQDELADLLMSAPAKQSPQA